MAPEPGRDPRRLRRIGAAAALVIGAALASRLLVPSLPQDQPLTFRLPERLARVATHLNVSFTAVGEREPAHGLSVALVPPNPTNIHERVHLPNGEYLIVLELTYTDKSGPSAPEKTETSRARRVSLAGEETVVVFEAEGSE